MRLSADESRALFRTADHAILGVNGPHGPPLVVPITFALVEAEDGARVVSAVDHKPKASTRLRRLALMRADPRVSVLVERYDDDWRLLRWARADGDAEVVPAGAPDPRRDDELVALAAKYPPYAGHPPQGDLVRIRVRRWTGWSGEDL